jgi:hypothetical protein
MVSEVTFKGNMVKIRSDCCHCCKISIPDFVNHCQTIAEVAQIDSIRMGGRGAGAALNRSDRRARKLVKTNPVTVSVRLAQTRSGVKSKISAALADTMRQPTLAAGDSIGVAKIVIKSDLAYRAIS